MFFDPELSWRAGRGTVARSPSPVRGWTHDGARHGSDRRVGVLNSQSDGGLKVFDARRLLEVEIEPGRKRLHLHVMVHDVDRQSQCRAAVVVGAAQVDETVFHPEADVTRHLVVDAGADGPSTAPVVEGKAVAQRRVLSGDIDLRAGPTSFAVDEPLIDG